MSEELNDYLLVLGKLFLVSKIYADEQMRIAQTGILQPEEMAQAENISLTVDQLADQIDFQLGLVSARTPKEWTEIVKEITDKLQKKEKS